MQAGRWTSDIAAKRTMPQSTRWAGLASIDANMASA
jgi:hypothetical protein